MKNSSSNNSNNPAGHCHQVPAVQLGLGSARLGSAQLALFLSFFPSFLLCLSLHSHQDTRTAATPLLQLAISITVAGEVVVGSTNTPEHQCVRIHTHVPYGSAFPPLCVCVCERERDRERERERQTDRQWRVGVRAMLCLATLRHTRGKEESQKPNIRRPPPCSSLNRIKAKSFNRRQEETTAPWSFLCSSSRSLSSSSSPACNAAKCFALAGDGFWSLAHAPAGPSQWLDCNDGRRAANRAVSEFGRSTCFCVCMGVWRCGLGGPFAARNMDAREASNRGFKASLGLGSL